MDLVIFVGVWFFAAAAGLLIGRWTVPRPEPVAPTDGPTIIPGCWYRLSGAIDVQVASIRDDLVHYGIRDGSRVCLWELPIAVFARHSELLQVRSPNPVADSPSAKDVTP